MINKIAVAGYIALDIIPKWERGSLSSLAPGKLLKMEGIRLSVGGVVGNTGIALKKLGYDVMCFAQIGDDYFGQIVLKVLEKDDKLLTKHIVQKTGGATSYTIVLNPPGTDRAFLAFSGENDNFSEDSIDINFIEEVIIFHFGYPPLMKRFYIDEGNELYRMFSKIYKKGIVTSLDMAMPDENSEEKINWENIIARVLPCVDIFMPSIDELLYMFHKDIQKDSLSSEILCELGNELLEMGGKVIGIKLGDQGLYIRTADSRILESSNLRNVINISEWANKEFIVPCFKTKVVGTTGAGDATIAGFIAGLAKGLSAEVAAKIAVGVGALSVSSFSCTDKIMHVDKVMEKIRSGWETSRFILPHENWDEKNLYGEIFIGPNHR